MTYVRVIDGHLSRREKSLMMSTGSAHETLKGELVCAKCYLKKADAKECQDVLLVKNAKGETTEYYVTKNKVSLESGEVLRVEEGSLYPALQRMLMNGWVRAEWGLSDTNRRVR